MASASTPVWATKSLACTGSVSIISTVSLPSAPMPSSSPASPVSSEPRQPNSPSTDTPIGVGVLADAARDGHVVVIAGGRLAIAHERTVHHHAGKAGANGLLAHRGRRA